MLINSLSVSNTVQLNWMKAQNTHANIPMWKTPFHTSLVACKIGWVTLRVLICVLLLLSFENGWLNHGRPQEWESYPTNRNGEQYVHGCRVLLHVQVPVYWVCNQGNHCTKQANDLQEEPNWLCQFTIQDSDNSLLPDAILGTVFIVALTCPPFIRCSATWSHYSAYSLTAHRTESSECKNTRDE